MAVAGNRIEDFNQIENFDESHDEARKFRVLIDARKLNDGGIGVYTQNLIEGLLEVDIITLRLLTKPQAEIPAAWRGRVEVIEDSAKPYSADEMWSLAKRIDFSEVDLFHVPHYTLPYNVPVPTVITVHDLIHINKPEKAYYPWIAKPLMKSSFRRADRILTVSQASRKEIDDFSKSNMQIMKKVRVVANALDPYFKDKRIKINGNGVLSKPKVCGKYLLALYSNLKPHKGLKDLLLAFEQIRLAYGDIKLALVGQGTEGIVAKDDLLEHASSTKGVIILGAVNKEELADLYRRAQALVVASFAEGFCLPIIEAQSMGTTVVSRPIPAALELLTQNDVACHDFTLKGLVQGLKTFLDRDVSQDAIKQEVLEKHLRKYDHIDIAKTVLNVYKEILEEGS